MYWLRVDVLIPNEGIMEYSDTGQKEDQTPAGKTLNLLGACPTPREGYGEI